MIYLDTFRHFCQEWINIQHPNDREGWPWDPEKRLYLINLYALPISEAIRNLPTPFISILIDWDENDDFCDPGKEIYRSYFDDDVFNLPRRYLFNPINKGLRNYHLSRFDYTSNTYGRMAFDWAFPDLRLIRVLASRPHVRYSVYDGEEYHILRKRLHQLEEFTNSTIHYSENLLDCTSYVQTSKKIRQKAPETMIIGAPIIGVLKPIRKSKEYKLINGVLGMCTDDVQLAIDEEKCFDEYTKIRVPFTEYAAGIHYRSQGDANRAKAVVYVCVEAPTGVFSFQEFTPNATISVGSDQYVRTIQHSFTIAPEFLRVNGRERWEVRLSHSIKEGLIPNIKENQKYLKKHYEKLFYRSDMPNGTYKLPGGQVMTSLSTDLD